MASDWTRSYPAGVLRIFFYLQLGGRKTQDRKCTGSVSALTLGQKRPLQHRSIQAINLTDCSPPELRASHGVVAWHCDDEHGGGHVQVPAQRHHPARDLAPVQTQQAGLKPSDAAGASCDDRQGGRRRLRRSVRPSTGSLEGRRADPRNGQACTGVAKLSTSGWHYQPAHPEDQTCRPTAISPTAAPPRRHWPSLAHEYRRRSIVYGDRARR